MSNDIDKVNPSSESENMTPRPASSNPLEPCPADNHKDKDWEDVYHNLGPNPLGDGTCLICRLEIQANEHVLRHRCSTCPACRTKIDMYPAAKVAQAIRVVHRAIFGRVTVVDERIPREYMDLFKKIVLRAERYEAQLCQTEHDPLQALCKFKCRIEREVENFATLIFDDLGINIDIYQIEYSDESEEEHDD